MATSRGPRPPRRQGRPARRRVQTARSYATKAANLTRVEGGPQVGRRAPPARDRRADLRGAREHEGRRDEGRAGGVVRGHGRVPAGDAGAHPGEARGAARRRPAGALQADARGDRGRTSDEPLEEVFAEFEEEAEAAASIGQVYRARLQDGRDVAVKVQYPGVAQAVRSDLQNLGLIMRVAKRIAPGMDTKAMTARDPRAAAPTSWTTSTRRSHTARSSAPGAGTRSSTCRAWSRACRASACS